MATEHDVRQPLPWIATLLAVAIASPFAVGVQAEQIKTAANRSSETSPTSSTPPSGPYCDQRFNTALSDALLNTPVPGTEPGSLENLVSSFADEAKSLDFIIATVPDPIDSGYGYMFQSLVHAIQLGAEAEVNGRPFYRTMSWLPWYETIESKAKESEGCRHQTPGFIAFRSDDENHFAVILLVGETPTNGIARLSMKQALTVVNTFRVGEPQVVRKRNLRILGPVFSGSAASLRQALANFETNWDVTIISGTATGTGLRKKLSDTSSAWFTHGTVEFWTTTVPEAVMQCRYLAFLCHYLNTEGLSGGIDVCSASNVDVKRRRALPVRLPKVALLHESGTQFGTSGVNANREPSCNYEAGFIAEFPVNISALRDAYESHDKDTGGKKMGARSTSLEVSLREPRTPPGMASQPSPKGIVARDLALSRTIAALERQHVTHVGIQATEIADAIFIGRKIRDVAPDIRIAVFQADSLLLHPDFRSLLLGALVVTPYPFLGTSELAFTSSDPAAREVYRNFENSNAQGVFNAILALQSAPPTALLEYDLGHPEGDEHRGEPQYSRLPVWIAAVGTNRFVPIAVVPNVLAADKSNILNSPVYPGLGPTPSVNSKKAATEKPWKKPFEVLHAKRERGPLRSHEPSLPWIALLLVVGLLSTVDVVLQHSKWKTLASRKDFRVPRAVTANEERQVDLVVVRLRWQLYASVRSGLAVFTILYLFVFSCLRCLPSESTQLTFYYVVGILSLLVPGYWCCVSTRDFFGDLIDFWRARSTMTEPNQSRILFAMKRIGVLKSGDGLTIVRVSQYQTTVLVALVAAAGIFLVITHIMAFRVITEAVTGDVPSELAEAITIERMLTLLGGVSPAAPTLLLLAIVYFWTVGRMASLHLTHSVSRMTPADGVPDFISTPIRLILYPKTGVDTAFTQVERNSVNAVVRPTTGPTYLCSFAALMILPLVLFMPSPISTLEKGMHAPLVALFYIGYGLIVSTLLQLFQYWFCLELLLKSVLQNSVGRAFSSAAPFVRESIDEQISKTPNDLLRLAACVGVYEDLQRWSRKPANTVANAHQHTLSETTKSLHLLREIALETLGPKNTHERAKREADLGLKLVEATRQLVGIVNTEREGQATVDAPHSGSEYSKDNARWINDVEAFTATVVTILINRHLRQLRNIVSPLLISVLLLLAAILSYPFEPRRLMTSSAWALILVSVSASVWTYLQLDRNTLLSNIASSNPGRVTPNAELVFRILKWGIVPVLAALAADYPDFVHTILKWVRPIPIWQ